MPHEQEMPAPVTTTILFALAIARDISERERLVWESALAASSSRVTVIVAKVKLHVHKLFDCLFPVASRPSRDTRSSPEVQLS
jgi:hypothetical protein